MSVPLSFQDLTVSVNFPARITADEIAPGKTRLHFSWDGQPEGNPAAEIRWSMPLNDIQYEWYPNCSMNRSLHVDFYMPEKSRISSSAPVFCFYNTAGRNRFTMALSDVLTEIDMNLGVHEENGELLCKVVIPLDATGLTQEYEVILYRDYDDISFAEALRRVSLWWESDVGLTPMPVPEAARKPLYSAWYSFHQSTIAEEIEAECARAVKLGLETIIVDDGWQTSDGNRGYGYCGDWRPTPDKIPDMRAHVANVHALGMKYMLWYSVPFVGKWSEHWNEFKDMLLTCRERLHAGVLDPRYPAVRDYLIGTYVRALKDWDLDGFKLDFIDSFIPSTKAPAPTPEMDFVKVEDAVVRLMTDVMNALRAIKPDILIEFRQSYIGPAMRTYGNMFRVGDCPADPLSNRVGMVDLRLLSGSTAVHSDMLMWHRDDAVENAARQLLSVLFAVPQISVRLDRIPQDHLDMLTFWIGFINRHRALLAAPIEVESPQNLYPLVRARLGEEEAVAVYDRHIASLSDAPVTYLFNASAEPYVIIRQEAPRPLTARVFNCLGQPAGEITLPAERLTELPIPVSGFAVIG